MVSIAALEAQLDRYGTALLGYSGGVDSALLAVAATRSLGPDRFLAVIGRSASYPAGQHATALELAGKFGIPLLEVETRELEDPRYLANPVNRCYFCKQELWSVLGRVALERGFETIMDGTNADDLGDHRPGMRAAAERSVRSPLAELGWTKAMVREAAGQLGIPTWSAPASPCLSSRVSYGLPVTVERLRQVEQGEAWLRDLGIEGDLRVRHHGDHVRIETGAEGQAMLARHEDALLAFFRTIGIGTVVVDPRGYRRGSLLNVLSPSA